MNEQLKISRFDQVQIATTKNIQYLSSPDENVTPQGIWSVAGVVNDDQLLIIKDMAIVRIPVTDVKLILQVDTKNILNKLGSMLNRGERKETD